MIEKRIGSIEHQPIADQLEPMPSDGVYPPIRALKIGAQTVGALAVGALAMGALAIGALAIGRLVIGRSRIRRLEIDELVVGNLHVTDLLTTPTAPRVENDRVAKKPETERFSPPSIARSINSSGFWPDSG